MSPEPDPFRGRRGGARRHPPALNVPNVILVLIGLFITVQFVQADLLGDIWAARFVLNFSFIPGCYADLDTLCDFRRPGADLWTPVTYALLHGGWTHLIANSVWLLAFGTPVARRVGTARFLAFATAGAVAGAFVFYLANPVLVVPVIGASGVVAALMGGACRFAFGGRDGMGIGPGRADLPVVSIGDALANRTVLIFVGIFFATNLLIGSGVGGAFGGADVAWEAHLGGFAFGFLGFRWFDPRSDAAGF